MFVSIILIVIAMQNYYASDQIQELSFYYTFYIAM